MTNVSKLKIRNPVMLAAGKQGDSLDKLKQAYKAGAGAVVTKSVTINEREPMIGRNFIKIKNGYINNVGLANVGAKKFAKKIRKAEFPIIVSLAGSDKHEITEMIEIFENIDVAGYEINLSCPNAPGFDVGDDVKLTRKIIKKARTCTDRVIFAKIAHHMRESAIASVDAGADAITAINTIPAMSVDIMTKYRNYNFERGGLSGDAIKPIALRTVHELSKTLKIPIIGCGGISTWRDGVRFLTVGATAVQVGSAAMVDISILGKISDGISAYENRTQSLNNRN